MGWEGSRHSPPEEHIADLLLHAGPLRQALKISFATVEFLPSVMIFLMINYYLAQSRGFYFKNILIAGDFGVTPMGGLSRLGLFLVRCSTNNRGG